MDGTQVGHYLDNVFAFRTELGLKIGLGKVAAEAGTLHGRSGAQMEAQLRMWGEHVQEPACWPPGARGLSMLPCLPMPPLLGSPPDHLAGGSLLAPSLLSVRLSISPVTRGSLRPGPIWFIFAFLARPYVLSETQVLTSSLPSQLCDPG